jgi:hypothetical protein
MPKAWEQTQKAWVEAERRIAMEQYEQYKLDNAGKAGLSKFDPNTVTVVFDADNGKTTPSFEPPYDLSGLGDVDFKGPHGKELECIVRDNTYVEPNYIDALSTQGLPG